MPLISTYGSSSSRSFGLNAFLKSILGGTLFSDSTYYYRAFLSDGELEINGFTTVNLDVLVIGGGGPGRQTAGGAGGIVYAANKTFSKGTYSVVIGQGGTPVAAAPGGNSTISDIIALGGGVGGLTDNTVGGNGGSGGGAGRDGIQNNTPGTGLQPSASNLGGGIGYGNRGGFASGTGWGGGGGGGGAGGVGGNGQGNANQANEVAGNAGAGTMFMVGGTGNAGGTTNFGGPGGITVNGGSGGNGGNWPTQNDGTPGANGNAPGATFTYPTKDFVIGMSYGGSSGSGALVVFVNNGT